MLATWTDKCFCLVELPPELDLELGEYTLTNNESLHKSVLNSIQNFEKFDA